MCAARARYKVTGQRGTGLADILKPDICVIGGGAGGRAVVETARAADASVALVATDLLDDSGRVAAAALGASAARADLLRHSESLGFPAHEPEIDFDRILAHMRETVAGSALRVSEERLVALGALVIRGQPRFIDRNTLDADGTLIRARRFVIATGSRPAVPDLPGLDGSVFFTPDTLIELAELPRHLIVLGGGGTGLALAQAYLRLGAEVTVIDTREPLGEEDPELAAVVLRRLAQEGLSLHAHTGVVAIRASSDGVAIDLKAGADEWTLEGTHLLVATGRAPDLDGLGLEAARIRSTPEGIAVNARLRTSNRKVYAIGEAIGAAASADHQARLVTRNALLGHRIPRDTLDRVARATFTDPEIAHVGLTEAAARARTRQRYQVLRWPYAENARARALGHNEGMAKLVTDSRGTLMGASIAGPQARETIALFAYAIANGLKAPSLAQLGAVSPSLAEIAQRIGVEQERKAQDGARTARRLRFNRLLP